MVTVLRAPSVLVSEDDGQLRHHLPHQDEHGLYRHDRRLLARLEITVNGAEPIAVGRRLDGPAGVVFHSVTPGVWQEVRPDAPALLITRDRSLGTELLTERITVGNLGELAHQVRLDVSAATDLVGVGIVRRGAPVPLVAPRLDSRRIHWETGGCHAVLEAVPTTRPAAQATQSTMDSGVAVLSWSLLLDPGQDWSVTLTMRATEDKLVGFRPDRPTVPIRFTPAVKPADERLDRLLARSLHDLDGLQLSDPDSPGSVFLAAGSPWYFTLFGRDSLWTARLLLHSGLTDGLRLAEGTLRALASRQGTREDPVTEEQPGKIPHEVRRADAGIAPTIGLPPVYYGTVDATALWIQLLYESWQQGMAADSVHALLPTLSAALSWMTRFGDNDGFLDYTGSPDRLAHQGWKDSAHGIRWADGRNPRTPIALCEVQGYAYQAALAGAALLDAFERSDAARWRDWAALLQTRFRDRFWLSDPRGRYVAIALDGDRVPVTGAASNMGHLLGTGLLDTEEVAAVASRLAAPDLDSGYGLRTLSSDHAAFHPLSYHRGSVWPHDTAITMLGLAAEGYHEHARSLAWQLVTAAESFDFRLPELYGGTDARAGEALLRYPDACAPQAWSAAAGVAVATYLTEHS